MQKLVMIKYGELSTKKDNIGLFLKKLRDNIVVSIGEKGNVSFDKGRMFIDGDIDYIISRLGCVFGIHEFDIVYKIGTSYEELKSSINNLLQDIEFRTFKVSTKRSNKGYFKNSMQISRDIGAFILKKFQGKKVDVNSPEILINIEIRTNAIYIYFEKYKGIGGYPVGSMGKGLLMLSGGIDSPVAGYLAMKRGIKIECLYFESPPHTSIEARNKVFELAKKLAVYNNGVKIHVVNFTKIQEEIYKNIPHEYLVTIMRRMMYRISAIIANNRNCKVLINGESIGQVASQTLVSMSVINSVINMPVIRPVACFDKLEIIDLAKKIETYETSILPYEDCCTIFVPDHPVINPSKEKCELYESLISYKELIYEAIKTHIIVDIDKNSNEFIDIL